MPDTVHLGLPLLESSQSQKHVTHNEALAAIDAAVHLAVISRALAAPPASPADGDRYLIAASATGIWAGHDGAVAVWLDGDSWDIAEVPLGEEREAYEFDVLDGALLKRRTALALAQFTYTLAQQTADFGGAAGSVSVRVAQMSQAFGRGTTLERMIHA